MKFTPSRSSSLLLRYLHAIPAMRLLGTLLTKAFERESAGGRGMVGEAWPRPYESTIFSAFCRGEAMPRPQFEPFTQSQSDQRSKVNDYLLTPGETRVSARRVSMTGFAAPHLQVMSSRRGRVG
jgi:hypothetical protein